MNPCETPIDLLKKSNAIKPLTRHPEGLTARRMPSTCSGKALRPVCENASDLFEAKDPPTCEKTSDHVSKM